MPDNLAVRISSVSKEYFLFNKPSDRVKEIFHPLGKKYHRSFYALSDISLEIFKGETFGIIGRNGCGKSTLLQIICGILQPTTGNVEAFGRISALLELGTGFNPEFTGRQNIYLKSSILGFSADQTDAHIDDIIDFADIGEYVEQPVRTYSSGMYVRLAFAVAISVKPEILIIDEALSVGDEAFQRKCFSHINSMQERGCTIIFVSHSAHSVINLCNRAAFIERGELILAGEPKPVVKRYQKLLMSSANHYKKMLNQWRDREDRYCLREDTECSSAVLDEERTMAVDVDTKSASISQSQPEQEEKHHAGKILDTISYESRGAVIEDVHLLDGQGRRVNLLDCGEKYYYCYKVRFEKPFKEVKFGMLIKTLKGIEICGSAAGPDSDKSQEIINKGLYMVQFPFSCLLNSGTYFLNAGVTIMEDKLEYLDRKVDVLMFKVLHNRNDFSTSIVDVVEAPEVRSISG